MFEIAVLGISVLTSLSVGLFVYARNPELLINKLYGVLTLSLVLYPIANYFSLHSTNRLLYIRAVIFFTTIAVAAMYFLVFYLNGKVAPLNRIQKLALYITGFIAILDLTPYVFSGLTTGANPAPIPNIGAILFILHLIVFPASSLLLLISRIHSTKGLSKIQYIYMLIGIAPILLVAPITSVILPVLLKDTKFVFLSPVYAAFFVSLIGYAIIKHKLFDIKFYVIRAAAYLLTTVLLSVVYIAPAMYILAIVIMGFPFVLAKFIVGTLFATLAAIYFDSLRKVFDKITAKIFFQNSYDYGQVLTDLNKILVSTIDLDLLLEKCATLIVSNLKADYCLFDIKLNSFDEHRYISIPKRKYISLDKIPQTSESIENKSKVIIVNDLSSSHAQLKKALNKNGTEILIKLSSDVKITGNETGFIMLGFKKSGNSYNSKDIKTLEGIADGLIIGVSNALRFDEIQKFNLTLQQKVDTATIQLRRTNAKLEALDETKDDFISMASHQLRTPLTSVKGYLSMVIDGDAGDVTPMQKKMLNQAFMSSQRMVFLIADLLNVSRLKTGKFVIEPVALDLSEMITQEIGQLRETAKLKSIDLKYEKPKKYPQLMLDETKTRQVVMNFIDNAIHYTPAGGHITIELIDKPQSAELRVRDDGIGVPKNEQHHLFTKFYRAVNARRERPDGTGLGLFMAKKVVVAQGGAVLFESKEGVGSMFGFTLPKEKLLVK